MKIIGIGKNYVSDKSEIAEIKTWRSNNIFKG